MTNFDLAPPPTTVDGLLAVPIDISTVTAKLRFDGATSTGTGDATIDFVLGPTAGSPIFDLRQTVTGAWLDGAPVPLAQAAHHDFGGGVDAELRVLEPVLAAGSAHSLRLTYDLGPPQASTAGSYQPGMTFTAGPRLACNFGFTDLGAGRYLEAWVPANLIYDQFEMTLELELVNTAVGHTVITNGTVTAVGANHWSVAFPARYTALSPLLELRATDTLAAATGTVTLPVSGTVVTIEAWKLITSAIDLAARVNDLEVWLADNEAALGPWMHGNRFVAFLHVGGMEYEGGTTSSSGSLRHEAFHSWWARGLKPASQPDGWWDEGWNVYHDSGGTGSAPFDFTDPPVTLCTRNPWARITAGASYTEGERFFEGVASLVGVAPMKTMMRDFYVSRRGRPATTTDLEAHLVARSGERTLVDAFHRFVYGFSTPSPAPDLWLRDDPAHAGTDAWAGRFWDSPDLWVRHADDGGTSHQEPDFGQDNWFHARVRNRSASVTARHFVVTFNVKPWAGMEFSYPGDFLPAVAAAAGFDLGPGQSTVLRARWPRALVPPAGTHACWLAAVLTRGDPPAGGAHVWEHNNLAQKNLTVVDVLPNTWFVLPFVIDRLAVRLPRPSLLELLRPKGMEKLEASLVHRSGAPFAGPAEIRDLDAREAPALRRFANGREAVFEPGRTAGVPLAPWTGGQRSLALRLRVPPDARAGQVLTLDLVHRDAEAGRVTGGLAMQLRVTDERRDAADAAR